jgi:hypothetical protein
MAWWLGLGGQIVVSHIGTAKSSRNGENPGFSCMFYIKHDQHRKNRELLAKNRCYPGLLTKYGQFVHPGIAPFGGLSLLGFQDFHPVTTGDPEYSFQPISSRIPRRHSLPTG